MAVQMSYRKRLQCNLCGERFIWEPEGFPDECPLCKQYIGLDGKPEVAAPFIGLRKAKSGDDVYRAMERGSEHRINVASEMLGIPKSELSGMKITNMGDNAKPGEDSAPKISESVNRLMQFNQKEAAQAVPMEVATRAFNQHSPQVVQEARQMTPEKAHPRSGVGSGINALANLRANKFAGG
jgi:hypothetical protein